MAKATCSMKCKHRSKRPMQKYKRASGDPCYGCTLDTAVISRIVDPEDYIIQAIGEEEMARCLHYEPVEEE